MNPIMKIGVILAGLGVGEILVWNIIVLFKWSVFIPFVLVVAVIGLILVGIGVLKK